MKRMRLLVSFLALITGALILGVSLTAVSPVLSSTEDVTASQRSFYLDDTILPDHVAYPLVMIADRVQLETTAQEELATVQVEYALRRLHYTESLLRKGEQVLALTTVTKSQKYLIAAAQAAINQPLDRADTEELVSVLVKYRAEIERISPQFTDPQRSVIDSLVMEIQSLEDQLRRQLQ